MEVSKALRVAKSSVTRMGLDLPEEARFDPACLLAASLPKRVPGQLGA